MNPAVPILFLAFAALGLPDGILGVAWPSMRSAFGVPLDALGLLLSASMAGYILSSFACGFLLARMGIGTLLSASNLITAFSLAGYALVHSFGALLAAGFLGGLGAGAVDAAVNTYAAFRFPPRTLNWLHASYSFGAFLGPLVMAGVISKGLAWGWGYGLVAGTQAVLAAVFLASRKGWVVPSAPAPASGTDIAATPASAPHRGGEGYRSTFVIPGVWTGVLAFLVYTALEFSVGQWAFTLLSQGRGLAPGKAALWAGMYWGGFLGGRILAGFLPLGDKVRAILRIAPMGMIAAAGLVLAGGISWVTLAGLALMGAAFAPVYPAMVASTPSRLGSGHAANAMGFQVAASTLGAAAGPGLIGVMAQRSGIESIAWAWLAAAFLTSLCLLALSRAGYAPDTGVSADQGRPPGGTPA
ncbi:MAG: major facilitator superfamily 1 [Fibrobacteres bacterium]|nr:major facilitator superfamily 1 [Fibrobacterota bacterium]